MEELQTVPDAQPAVADGPAALMALAIQSGNIETVERMMQLQERHDVNEARKAYHRAMSQFKAEKLVIGKDKLVDFSTSKGRTTYRHATLFNVVETITPALSRYGLSATWQTLQEEGNWIVVTCTITHELGHSESTTLKARPDDSGNKNSIQQVGSTVSYLQRYTLLAITGLATTEQQDDDARGAGAKQVTLEQGALLLELYEVLTDEKQQAFTEWLTTAYHCTLDSLPAKAFESVRDSLKRGAK